ncbi:MAG: NTP transferase domain-containing protein [Lewinellaceae bacterium]|nr:NTP transferase domain-containing protein [Phaeodactylibacter sp.]MCB9038764.1 NTP transferase domain-containing protein [Lewinellaceae bacterium]
MPQEDQKHQKHAKLTRPGYGHFHRREWAILGTPCGNIKKLAYGIIDRLSDSYRVGYVDADHAGVEAEAAKEPESKSAMDHGARMEYIDKIGYHRLDFEAKLDSYQYRMYFNEQDAVIVNGNHFPARRQIVVIDPKKEGSLKRRIDQLTDVRLILLVEGVNEVYPWLREKLEGFSNIPLMKLQDEAGIAILIEKELAADKAPLYGLVLAGGKSERMGRDKGLIDYHGQPQREHLAEMLGRFCKETFISCRPDQAEQVEKPLPDTFTGLGPFGGILSAFREQPDAAWLVVACDLPLLDEYTISQLAGFRNPSKVATAFNSPASEFPEPLIAIWEPRSYPILLQFLAQGYSCPRKVLINSNVELLDAERPEALRNVNKPDEMEEVKAVINPKA